MSVSCANDLPYQIRGAKMIRIFENYKADRIDFQDFDKDFGIFGLAGILLKIT